MSSDFGIHEIISFPDGEEAKTSLNDLLTYADFFASMYGLGANRSLTEFIEMINKEDPIILEGLKNVAIKRIKAQYGNKNSEEEVEDELVGFIKTDKDLNSKSENISIHNSNTPSKDYLIRFLTDFGASRAQIEKALEDVRTGKAKVSNEDYNWITPETLASPNFDFKGALAKLRKGFENSAKIEVSIDTLLKSRGIIK